MPACMVNTIEKKGKGSTALPPPLPQPTATIHSLVYPVPSYTTTFFRSFRAAFTQDTLLLAFSSGAASVVSS